MWSEQFNPEGYAEKGYYKSGDWTLFGTALQMAVNTATGANQWMFGEQLGGVVSLDNKTALKLAVGYYLWDNATKCSFNPATLQSGNTISGTGSAATLRSNFGVAELVGEYATQLWGKPVSLQGIYIKNPRRAAFHEI